MRNAWILLAIGLLLAWGMRRKVTEATPEVLILPKRPIEPLPAPLSPAFEVPPPSEEEGLPLTVRTASGRIWSVQSYFDMVQLTANTATGWTTFAKNIILALREAGALLGQPGFPKVCVRMDTERDASGAQYPVCREWA